MTYRCLNIREIKFIIIIFDSVFTRYQPPDHSNDQASEQVP